MDQLKVIMAVFLHEFHWLTSPMLTQATSVFFFLASPSMESVGSAPALRR